MSVSRQNFEIRYFSQANQRDFLIDFNYDQRVDEKLVVTLDGIPTNEYVVVGIPEGSADPTSYCVRLDKVPKLNCVVKIARITERNQDLNYSPGLEISNKNIIEGLNKVTRITQENLPASELARNLDSVARSTNLTAYRHYYYGATTPANADNLQEVITKIEASDAVATRIPDIAQGATGEYAVEEIEIDGETKKALVIELKNKIGNYTFVNIRGGFDLVDLGIQTSIPAKDLAEKYTLDLGAYWDWTNVSASNSADYKGLRILSDGDKKIYVVQIGSATQNVWLTWVNLLNVTAEKGESFQIADDELQEQLAIVAEKLLEENNVRYIPTVLYHDPNRIAGNNAVALNNVITGTAANEALYTEKQAGSFVSDANFVPPFVDDVTYGTLTAKALNLTYNGNIFADQQLIKFEVIDSTGELAKEYAFPLSTIQNGFDYVVTDALANSSIHKKEIRFRVTYDIKTNKSYIRIHQRPVNDPPPALYLFIVVVQKVIVKGVAGRKGEKGGFPTGEIFPVDPKNGDVFGLTVDIVGYDFGVYYFNETLNDWKNLSGISLATDAEYAAGSDILAPTVDQVKGSIQTIEDMLDLLGHQFHGRLVTTRIYKSGEIFDFDGTLIQVRDGETFQASVDATTWNDSTWKGLVDIRTGALRTKLEVLTFPDALTFVSVVGNTFVFKRANEPDLVVPIPLPADGTIGKAKLTSALQKEITDAASSGGSGGSVSFKQPPVIQTADSDKFLLERKENQLSPDNTIESNELTKTGYRWSGQYVARTGTLASGNNDGHGLIHGGGSRISTSARRFIRYIQSSSGIDLDLLEQRGSSTPRGFEIDGMYGTDLTGIFFGTADSATKNFWKYTVTIDFVNTIRFEQLTKRGSIGLNRGSLSVGSATSGLIFGAKNGSLYPNSFTKFAIDPEVDDDGVVELTELTVTGDTLPSFVENPRMVGNEITGLIFGGETLSPSVRSSDMYRYEVTGTTINIKKLTNSNSITGRIQHEMIGNANEGIIYGGKSATGDLGDFVKYVVTGDSVTYTPLTLDGTLAARYNMNILGTIGNFMIFGGDSTDFSGNRSDFNLVETDTAEVDSLKVVTKGDLFSELRNLTNINNKEVVESLDDDDELLVEDYSFNDKGITLTAGLVWEAFTTREWTEDLYGWSYAIGRNNSNTKIQYLKGGTFAQVPEGLHALWTTRSHSSTDLTEVVSLGISLRFQAGSFSNLAAIVVNDKKFTLNKTADQNSGYYARTWGGRLVEFDFYSNFSDVTEDDLFVDGGNYDIKFLDADGNVIFGERESVQKKALYKDIKQDIADTLPDELTDEQKRILAEASATTKTFGAAKVPTDVLNNNGHLSRAIASNGAYAKLGSVGEGWTLRKLGSNDNAEQPDEFKILYLGYYQANNTTNILIQTDQREAFTAIVNGTSLNFNTLNASILYKGKQTRYNAGAITGTIKTMLDSEEFTLAVTGYAVQDTVSTEKVLISPKWDIGEATGGDGEDGAQGYQGVFQVRLFTQINSAGAGSLATPPAKPDGNWEWHESVSALRRKTGASAADANYALWQAQASGITALNGDIWVVLALWNPATGQTSAWSDPIATDPDHAQALAGIPGKDGKDGKNASTLFADATDKLTNNNITDNTISGNKLQDNTLQGRKLAASSVTNSKIGVGISGNKIANIPESSLDTAARTKLNAAADLGTATGNLAGSKISDSSIAGTKLANLTIPSSKLGANSVTNSKVSNGIAGSKISNIPESSLSSGVQTKLNASGGGGGASVSTDAQFATGSDTLAPSVNQSKSYADSKDAFLVLWEGQFGNASADNVTTIGNKATISGLNEYDATNDRQTITKGGGAGNNTLIEWENPNIDARRATFLSELSMNTSNWTMSAQIGYTSLVAGDNALEIQQGGWGFLCTRSAPIIGNNPGIFGLSLFVGQGGSLGATVSPREMAQSQVELRGGALAPNGNNPYVRLPYDTDADKVVLHVERIGRLFRVYTDGILRMIVSLNDAQAAVPGNSGKFGYAGNPANTPSIRYYLLKAAVGNTVIRPLSGAGGGSSTVADNSVSTAKIQNLAVTGPKIASNAVITTKIANGAITGPKIDANAVDTAKIFNGSVTEAKLATSVQTKLNASGGGTNLSSLPAASDNRDILKLFVEKTVRTPVPGSNSVLYMIGDNNNALFRVNTTTGVATRIGRATSFGVGETSPGGLAYGNGVLYMVGAETDALYTLNTTTGVATRIGSASAFGVSERAPSGLAYDPNNNILYMIGDNNNALFRVNTTTGVATRIGSATSFNANESLPGGLAYDPNNNILYMIGDNNNALFRVNTTTGVATRIGSASIFGGSEETPSGLAYDPNNNILYMVGVETDALYTLNTTTGVATRIGSASGFGVGETSPGGLAYSPGVFTTTTELRSITIAQLREALGITS